MGQYVIKCIKNPCGSTNGQWHDGDRFYRDKPVTGIADINFAYHTLYDLYGNHNKDANCGCIAEVVELEYLHEI